QPSSLTTLDQWMRSRGQATSTIHTAIWFEPWRKMTRTWTELSMQSEPPPERGSARRRRVDAHPRTASSSSSSFSSSSSIRALGFDDEDEDENDWVHGPHALRIF